MIEFSGLKREYAQLSAKITPKIQSMCEKAQFIMGEEVALLEKNLGAFSSSKHAITCSSGTSALLLAFMALGLKENDEVITSAFSFISVVEMLRLLKIKPILVDIDPKTFHMDINLVQKAITPRTKAIVPVSLFGLALDYDPLLDIAKKHHLILIEDAAQSFGATYKNQMSVSLPLLATTSFFPSKPLGCYGDGGAIFCQDEELANKLKFLRVHGQTKRYEHEYLGLGARLDALQAGILNIKLEYYKETLKKREKVAKLYTQYLKNSPFELPSPLENRSHIYAQYSLLSSKREQVLKALEKAQIPYAIHYPKGLYLQKSLKDLDYNLQDFPNTHFVSERIFSVPMHPYLKEEEILSITKVLKSI
ncbi:DegT/DnrJ/EryC1/StrS family aminotransferase [Helicobacter cetorum]|uniref:DegT/DnrJ/EryC1/StrS family aminotransferase n=1 Tax=Helicobacter cetorum TaxID=138563 RepID=UPI001F3E9E00|nr:DegT/DnrJ/EryC1/StrS family aminotransferase [Helicobacter cetorum]